MSNRISLRLEMSSVIDKNVQSPLNSSLTKIINLFEITFFVSFFTFNFIESKYGATDFYLPIYPTLTKLSIFDFSF